MFKEIRLYVFSHGIKYEVDAFSSGLFCCRYKVTVSGNQNNSVDLLLEGHRRDVNANHHIDTLLLDFQCEVGLCQLIDGQRAVHETF